MATINIELLAEKNKLTLDKENNIFVHPINQYSFTTYPLPLDKEGCIVISLEEYCGIREGVLMFNEELNGVIEITTNK